LFSWFPSGSSYLQIGHDPFFPYAMQFITCSHPIIGCYLIWITDRIIIFIIWSTAHLCSWNSIIR
jgi:hypothetical protein